MSSRLVDYVFRNSKATGNALVVMLILADWANDGGNAPISMVNLATKARRSIRQVQRVLQALEEAGEIEVHRGKGIFTDSGPTNLYIIRGPHQAEWNDAIRQENQGVTSVSPLPTRGDISVTPSDGSDGVKKEQGVTSMSPKDLKDKRSKDSVAAQRANRPRNLAYDATASAFPHIKLPALIKKHEQMLSGKDTGRKEEWNEFRLSPGLRPYEIEQFGKWMNAKAELGGYTAPRQPEKIAQWAEDWRTEIDEEIELSALQMSQTIWVDDFGNDLRYSKEHCRQYLLSKRAEAEQKWIEDHS